jgi:hypothetical protein
MSLIAFLLACGKADTAEAEDPEAHACETVGAGGALTAGAAPDDTAPALPIGEAGYVVTLVDGAPGYLKVDVAEPETAALLFLDTADVVTGLWFEATEETLPAGAPNDQCATEIPEHFDLDFHEAGTWYIQVGPAAVTEAWMLLHDAAGHVHE